MKNKLQFLKGFILSAFTLVSMTTVAQFSGNYDPSNWVFQQFTVPSDGYVNTSGAPNSIELAGDNDGSGGASGDERVSYSIDICASGNISFDYSHVNPDWDEAYYEINGVRTAISIGTGTGSLGPIPVDAGDNFAFLVVSYDDCCGRGVLTISNFIGTAPTGPTPVITVDGFVPPTTCGGNDGSIDVSMSNGAAPYSYDWNGGTYTTEDISGLTAGGYGLDVTDANGCVAFNGVILNDPGAPTITVDAVTDVSCNGASDGAISITTTGGTAPYTFDWNAGMFTTEDITSLSGALYYLAAIDASGCTSWEYLTVNEPDAFSVTVSAVVDLTCNGWGDGMVQVTTYGGTGPYTYDWNGGMYTTEDLLWVAGGVYNLTATDGSGCVATTSATVIEPAAIVVVIDNAVDADCNGASTGLIDISVTGGTAPFTYSWNGGMYTTEDISNLPTGGYNIDVNDANGCWGNNFVTISEPTVVSIVGDAQTDPTSCGASDGTVSVTASGGTPGYTFDWNSGAYTTEDIASLPSGTYNLTVTDANGCTGTYNTQLNDPGAPSIAVDGITNTTCNGDSDGAIVVTTTGGTPAYTFDWNSGTYTTEDLSGLAAGVYNLVVSDAGGCTAAVSLTVTEPGVVTPNVDWINDLWCNGDGSGNIDVTTTGGTLPYGFDWNSGTYTTEDINSLDAGTYNLTVTDVNGCTGATVAVVTEPTAVVPVVTSAIDVDCNGNSTGSIDITTSGGLAPYNFQWNGGIYWTEDLSGLAAGTYDLDVWDWNGCMGTESVVIAEPVLLDGTSIETNLTCNGDNSGAIDLTIFGGTAPYTYDWNAGTYTTEDLTGLAAGTYTITATDANGCVVSQPLVITEPAALAIAIDGVTDVDCNSASTGAIAITTSGGVAPYTFDWNTGAYTTEDLTSLPAGNYNLTVTDANGCIITTSATVTEPTVLNTVVDLITDIDCNGNNNGAIDVTTTGGVAPYLFDWNTGMYTTEDIASLAPGTYNLTVTDANACTTTASATITEPTLLDGSSIETNLTCNGDNSGAIDLTIFGGTAPYTYDWNAGTYTTEDLAGLAAGTYTITATDANGCVVGQPLVITEPATLAIAVDAVTDPSSCGSSDGAISLTTSGGTTAYSFDWNSGTFTSEDISTLSSGTYNLTVTDANGCTITYNTQLNDPGAPTITVDNVTDVDCNSNLTGDIAVTATGGTTPYGYDWNGGMFITEDISALAAGIYNLTLTDASGCTAAISLTVNEPLPLSTTITATNVSCFGGNDGEAIVTPAGGTSPYTYVWTPGAILNQTASGLVAGSHCVDVTDANGCSANECTTITEPLALSLSATSTDEILGNDGTIDLTVVEGTPPYTYIWSNLAITEDLTGLTAGSYTVTVTDSNGCTDGLLVVVGTQVGLEEFDFSAAIYPNPNSGIFNVAFENTENNISYAIRDMQGKLIDSKDVSLNSSSTITINIENVERGIYFITFTTDKGNYSTRIIKQ